MITIAGALLLSNIIQLNNILVLNKRKLTLVLDKQDCFLNFLIVKQLMKLWFRGSLISSQALIIIGTPGEMKIKRSANSRNMKKIIIEPSTSLTTDESEIRIEY